MSAQAAPFDTRLIEERLRERLPKDALRQIAGAAEFSKVSSLQDFPAPCAYVLLARETAEDVREGGSVPGTQVPLYQPVRVSFGVVLALKNYREERGAQMTPELITLLGQVRGALMGFVPNLPGARACQFKQGDLTTYDAGTLLWTDVWQTKHTIGVDP